MCEVFEGYTIPNALARLACVILILKLQFPLAFLSNCLRVLWKAEECSQRKRSQPTILLTPSAVCHEPCFCGSSRHNHGTRNLPTQDVPIRGLPAAKQGGDDETFNFIGRPRGLEAPRPVPIFPGQGLKS
eukprot:1176981-Prorocentrum_minimum.AAC.2